MSSSSGDSKHVDPKTVMGTRTLERKTFLSTLTFGSLFRDLLPETATPVPSCFAQSSHSALL